MLFIENKKDAIKNKRLYILYASTIGIINY